MVIKQIANTKRIISYFLTF